MEIGALDEYDVFRDPDIKYIVATEDVCEESNKRLRLILEASGSQRGSFSFCHTKAVRRFTRLFICLNAYSNLDLICK
jgi:hypothetical protein